MKNVYKIIKDFFSASIFLAIAFYLSPCVAAETISENLLPGWDAIQQPALQTDISYLASDQLQGRLALQSGNTLAIQWIAKQFAKAGLKPVTGQSYLQPVKIIEYVPDRGNSYLSLVRSGKTIQWKKPDVFTEFYQNIDLSGAIVFAGYGITAPDLRYDDYDDVSVRGKVVLIFEHEPQETNANSIFNGTANTCHATARIKALNAQKHGAIAVLIAPEPNRKHPSNQERFMRIGGSVARAIPLPSMVLQNDELHIPVVILSDAVAKEIAGSALSLSELQLAIDNNLKPQSRLISHATIKLHDQMQSHKTGISYNVAGVLEGSNPKLKNETIIISAHHDHDGMSGNEIWHGADDNASGTAGVVALAHAMTTNQNAKTGLKLKRSILFVVFAAEERGLLGAFYMAAHPLRPLATTRAMLNFDMIGRNETRSLQTDGIIDIPTDTTNRLNLIGAHYSPEYNETVIAENKFVGLTLDSRFDNEPVLNTFFRSDQFPFVLHNVPAFWWFTGFHPDYHHVTDTADKINYAKMQKILRLAYLTAYTFANEKVTPQFVKNPGGGVVTRNQ
jgi:hypothetical protein